LPPDALIFAQKAPKMHLAAGHRCPRPSSWIEGVLRLRGRKGRRGEERGEAEKGKGMEIRQGKEMEKGGRRGNAPNFVPRFGG